MGFLVHNQTYLPSYLMLEFEIESNHEIDFSATYTIGIKCPKLNFSLFTTVALKVVYDVEECCFFWQSGISLI